MDLVFLCGDGDRDVEAGENGKDGPRDVSRRTSLPFTNSNIYYNKPDFPTQKVKSG